MASSGNTGTVRNWFEHKGFGFIVPDQNGSDGYPLPDIFVHRHALIGVQSLVPGSAVRYRQGWNVRKNSPQADAVQVSSIPLLQTTAELQSYQWQREPSTPSEQGSWLHTDSSKWASWSWHSRDGDTEWINSPGSASHLQSRDHNVAQIENQVIAPMSSRLETASDHSQLLLELQLPASELVCGVPVLNASTQTAGPTVKPLPPRPRNVVFGPAIYKDPLQQK